MSFRNEGLIDELDWKIVEALQIDARLSMAALGRKIGLSAPATTERVRRLEERKVICAYRAEIELDRVGTTKCSQIVRGFSFGNGMGSAAEPNSLCFD